MFKKKYQIEVNEQEYNIIINTLNEFLNIFGDINIVVAREITKIHEQFFRGKISEVINLIDSPKGEFIIILEIKKIKKEMN